MSRTRGPSWFDGLTGRSARLITTRSGVRPTSRFSKADARSWICAATSAALVVRSNSSMTVGADRDPSTTATVATGIRIPRDFRMLTATPTTLLMVPVSSSM